MMVKVYDQSLSVYVLFMFASGLQQGPDTPIKGTPGAARRGIIQT